MKCDKVVEEYLKYEDFYHIPFVLKLHILLCGDCRREIFGIKSIFILLKSDSLYKLPYDITPSVMDRIRIENVYSIRTISGIKWVAIGSVIFISILLINFSESFLWMKSEFGSDYTLPLSIVLGSVFTAYAAVVVGCNYENMKKYIDLHSKWRFK